ncbi:hypothetical protein [uncultured Algoriphagus sp.]|mgnify:CR=1 FL=1|jgi:hypothetical protein|uniref:hypothetical protein n=1 Tax=uncultured Algoriphagus sp. TaxID=417365 RepID=UPI0025884A44|nr:hypothetical protein [uncultured Algoriphagus sp.]
MSELLYKPKALGLMAIVLNLIPTYWTYFFFITIPVIICGLVFIFIKPTKKLIYEIPAAVLIIGSILGLLLTVVSIQEMYQIA